MIVKTEKIKLNANAKINLTLEVLGKREDGYHELRSVMHSIGIFDTVELELSPQGVCARAKLVWIRLFRFRELIPQGVCARAP
ncbi:MAG: hypothetical protein IK064_05130, partial [Clostridia bacterium]|nr:hypothetical protein [Clostridia bacterium]